MAGINVPQYEVFKIETSRMSHSNWNYTTTVREAREQNAYVALFESQLFRMIANILGEDISKVKFRDYVLMVVISSKAHFNIVTKPEGVVVNGKRFRRFVGTTNGLKLNTLVFINVDIFDELYRRCECGRDPEHKLVPAKYEAYKSLTCSASQPIPDPKGILVVSDCLVRIKEDVIEIDDSGDEEEPVVQFKKDVELENNASDGFNLCTIEYMKRVGEALGVDYVPSGVCLRNAWLKGMLYPFPIVEFAERENGRKFIVQDIWGNEKDLREIEMILTESSLKLWDCYSSIEDYIAKTKEFGYGFAVTKIAPHELEDIREVNYQYLQSYDLSDEDIKKLCRPTVEYLKGAMGGDYKTMCEFIGANEESDTHTWQRGLYESDFMMDDPFVLDSIQRYIRKKVDQAKIGKLRVNGNYQIGSGDPFLLMQHICGLKETGLLKANEIYSSYWISKGTEDVLVFRSPMTSHNNIRRCKVVNVDFWYQYMNGIIIVNSFDTFCEATNGADWDGDIFYSTNNEVLLKNHKKLPAIICIQRNVPKIIVTEADILKSNLGGMGNKVGSITNRATAMMEVIASYCRESDEYKILSKRIEIEQMFQQNELDKLKGVVAKPMPKYWYDITAAKRKDREEGTDGIFERICCHKRPYFMTYVYPEYRAEYLDYNQKTRKKCKKKFKISYENLQKKKKKTKKMIDFIQNTERFEPFGMGLCTMNKICYYIEDEFRKYHSLLKKASKFDYTRLMKNGSRRPDKYFDISDLVDEHQRMLEAIKDDDDKAAKKKFLLKTYRDDAFKICSDENELADIMLALTYGQNKNQELCWGYVGMILCKRLKEMKHG